MDYSNGLGVWLDLASHIRLDLLIQDAEKQRINLHSAGYYSENTTVSGLRLGFAHLNKEEMTNAIQRLKHVFSYQSKYALSA